MCCFRVRKTPTRESEIRGFIGSSGSSISVRVTLSVTGLSEKSVPPSTDFALTL